MKASQKRRQEAIEREDDVSNATAKKSLVDDSHRRYFVVLCIRAVWVYMQVFAWMLHACVGQCVCGWQAVTRMSCVRLVTLRWVGVDVCVCNINVPTHLSRLHCICSGLCSCVLYMYAHVLVCMYVRIVIQSPICTQAGVLHAHKHILYTPMKNTYTHTHTHTHAKHRRKTTHRHHKSGHASKAISNAQSPEISVTDPSTSVLATPAKTPMGSR